MREITVCSIENALSQDTTSLSKLCGLELRSVHCRYLSRSAFLARSAGRVLVGCTITGREKRTRHVAWTG
jgi:hypothetical protein